MRHRSVQAPGTARYYVITELPNFTVLGNQPSVPFQTKLNMVEATIPEETPLQPSEDRSSDKHDAKKESINNNKSTNQPSVFDRLYAERPRRTRGEAESSNTVAKDDPKPVKDAKRTRPKKDVPNSASLSFTEKKTVDEDAESINSSISNTTTTSNVYERLYRSTTQSRKASQRTEPVHGQVPPPRKTRERDVRNKERNSTTETSSNENQKASQPETDNATEPIDTVNEEENRPASSSFFNRPLTALKSARLQRVIQNFNGRQAFSSTKRKVPRRTWKIHKIPAGLLERGSIIRGAIPLLPYPAATICLIFNILLPGLGTLLSGFIVLGCGAPRFSTRPTAEHRVLACLINCGVGVFQAVTILFCLVGWCWSLAWGITMINLAGQYRELRQQSQAEMMNSVKVEEVGPTLINLENETVERF